MKEYTFSIFGSGLRAGIWNGAESEQVPFIVQEMNQVHGTQLHEVSRLGPQPEADALWTRETGLRLAVKTADCIPLVLADEETGIIAVIHAGWRGLTADIIPKTIHALEQVGLVPSRIKLGIGPSLGTDCAFFSNPFEEIPEKYHWAIQGGRVDLNGIAREQLMQAGIGEDQIEWFKLCTHCDSAWPSWRRDGTKRRFKTWIERK